MTALEFITSQEPASLKTAFGVSSAAKATAIINDANNGDDLAIAKVASAAAQLGWTENTTVENSSDLSVEGVDIQLFTTEKGEKVPFVLCQVVGLPIGTERYKFKRTADGRKDYAHFAKPEYVDANNPKGYARNNAYGKMGMTVEFNGRKLRAQQVYSNLDELEAKHQAAGKSLIGKMIPVKYNADLLKGVVSILSSASPMFMSLLEMNDKNRQAWAQLSDDAKAEQRAEEDAVAKAAYKATVAKASDGLIID